MHHNKHYKIRKATNSNLPLNLEKNMNQTFKEILPDQIMDNPFKLIGKDWMLITAGNHNSYNTMTASWGGLGHLWEKNVCF